MRSWTKLEGKAVGRAALVVGNGPSRLGLGGLIHHAAADGLFIVGCNAYWRELLPEPDALVCYDGTQSEAAANQARGSYPIVVPEQRDSPVRVLVESDRYLEATPHIGTAKANDALRPDWWPSEAALGSFSGMLAYQVAMLSGASSIFLLGIDNCGKLLLSTTENLKPRVQMSAVGELTPGYSGNVVESDRLRYWQGRFMPDGWVDHLGLWSAMIRRAEQRGVKTFLANSGSALDWLPLGSW